ncbi:MAG: hypothetical protein ACI9G1_004184 [Pirellulaceae bacterium]|jgi:hypothetical protein
MKDKEKNPISWLMRPILGIVDEAEYVDEISTFDRRRAFSIHFVTEKLCGYIHSFELVRNW